MTTENTGKNSGRRGRPMPGNLCPWQPGRSPNPGGRPKRKPITDALKAELEQACRFDPEGRTNLEAGVRKLVDPFVAGVPHAIRAEVERMAAEHGLDPDELERRTWEIIRGG